MNGIGFIGTGNMGGAMLTRIAEDTSKTIFIYDANPAVYEQFKKVNITPTKDIASLAKACKYIMLTVKPQYYQQVCSELKNYISAEHVIVTVAPGVTIKKMHELLGEAVKIVRTMPNTPAMVGEGVTAYCYEEGAVEASALTFLRECFESFGAAYHVTETMMDAVVPTSGSSPAYGYLFIEAMADAAVRFGLPRQMAYEMAARSIKGACEMILQTKEHPGALKDAVTSPGGTTIEAIAKLEETGFRHSVIASMTACYDKTKQMKGE